MSLKHRVTNNTKGNGKPRIVQDELRTRKSIDGSWNERLRLFLKTLLLTCTRISESYFRNKIGKPRVLLIDEITRPQAMDIINSMIDRVEVIEGVEQRTFDNVPVGDLDAIHAKTKDNTVASL